MLKAAFTTILGLLTSVFGIYLIYLYLVSLNGTGQLWLLGASLLVIIFAIVLLINASKSEEAKPAAPPPPVADKFGSVMQRNNQLISSWLKESDKRDKMKILSIAAAAEQDTLKQSKTHV